MKESNRQRQGRSYSNSDGDSRGDTENYRAAGEGPERAAGLGGLELGRDIISGCVRYIPSTGSYKCQHPLSATPPPLNYDEAKPGMLISAETSVGRRVLGLAFQGDREVLLAVFWQSGPAQEPTLPYVIELSDVHQSLHAVLGDREFEASENSFVPLTKRQARQKGFIITSDGTVGLSVRYQNFGTPTYLTLDFETGGELRPQGAVAMLSKPRIFIRAEGRDQRIELEMPNPVAG